MTVKAVLANLSCIDLARSERWFALLFDRPPDARPMPGLAEWSFGDSAGFQLHEETERAGRGTLTLLVADVAAERERLIGVGVAAPEPEPGGGGRILRLRDPDGSLVVLADAS